MSVYEHPTLSGYSVTSSVLSVQIENSTSKSNSSSEENNDEILRKLNSEKVLVLLPVIIFVFLTITIGIIGNFLVCYIYRFRLRRSPSRYFILFLAVLDLISCVVGAASELSDLFQPYVFTSAWSCKILRFGLSFTIISASFTLICVAFDRYYKVCRPLKAFPVRKVKILCLVVIVLSIGLSSPALAIFGLKSVETSHAGLIGTECSTSDKVKGSALPIVYYVILFTAFIVLLACFVLLYVRIGIEIWKRKKLTIGETLPALIKGINNIDVTKYTRNESVPLDDASSRSVDDYSESRPGCESAEPRAGCENFGVVENDSYVSTLNRTNTDDSLKEQKTLGRKHVLRRRRSTLGRMSIRTLRTTSIFFAVSAAFVLSFLPYLIANILKFTKVAFYDIESSSVEVVYNFCVRSYFISNCINPIIYSALNVNFRKECKRLVKRILQKLKSCCMCRSE